MSRQLAWAALGFAASGLSTPLLAQGAPAATAEEALDSARETYSVAPQPAPDPCAQEDADPDTIVVCRQSQEAARYMIGRPVRADTNVTGSGAPRAQDPGGMLKPCSAYAVCVSGIGKVPPPAVMVDFGSLPETPAGSPAARFGGPTVDAAQPEPAPEADSELPEEDAEISESARVRQGISDGTYGP